MSTYASEKHAKEADMSGPFAIAAVTAVLKDLLNNGLADHDLSGVGNVAVTALPPDRIPVTNADEKSQLNLFLYQTLPNTGWRNVGLPSHSATGERLANPPLALDLRYLITAYGEKEFHAEVLLGYAMQLLHETPVLTRQMINATLKPALPPEVTLPPGLQLLSTSDLADQVELIKITPHYLNAEEMSRLWSAMQAKYRPTAVYHVSVVLIEADKARRAPLPVLKRGEQDRGPSAQANMLPSFPTIDELTLPKHQIQALLGDTVTLDGHDFAGETGDPTDVTVTLRLVTARRQQPTDIAVPAGNRSDRQVTFDVPDTPAALPAGLYALAVVVTPNGKPDEARSSNEVPLLIAPRITSNLAMPIARTGVDANTQLGTATINLTCHPEVLPEQRLSLVLGAKEVPPQLHPVQTNTLVFVARGMAAGEYRVRLRVDGAESLLIDRSDPNDVKFDETQKLVLT
jgi:Pvc16 N-terminal domain